MANQGLFRVSIIILFSLFIFSCSGNENITGNNSQGLYKPSDIENINTGGSDTNDPKPGSWEDCMLWNSYFAPWIFGYSVASTDDDMVAIDISYDFRDNFLDFSKKGKTYISMYAELSKFSIKNNLLNQYFKEHRHLLDKSVKIARELHHGNNDSAILIDEEITNELLKMVDIYRSHPNHREIEDVLNVLETDLKKYQYQPKSVIAKDFK